MQQRLRGVLSPALTPFDRDLAPDVHRFIIHCRWLQSQNCGLAVFGTNSEANSQSASERMMLLDHLMEASIDPVRMMPGTGCNSLTETVALTSHAVRHGCSGVLMLPPFYYKGVTEEGLFRYFGSVIDRVADPRLRVYLYHIPPVAVVGITPALVERLLKAYPATIAGMKDSSGDWENTRTFLDAFGPGGFDVFAGSESFLLATLRGGGAGCISATANINPAAIHKLFVEWQSASADAQQQALNEVRKVLARQSNMIAALKAVVADQRGDAGWSQVRPPLIELTDAEARALNADLRSIGFSMAGISGG